MTAKAETAAIFHRLHQGPEPLLLPNAWDAGSARLVESLGADAYAPDAPSTVTLLNRWAFEAAAPR